MDDPSLDREEHRRALRGLRRINRVSLTQGRLGGLVYEMSRTAGGRALRVVDLACGSGDTVRWLGRMAISRGLGWEVMGVDRSEVAIDEARRLTPEGLSGRVRFVVGDVLAGLGGYDADIVTCNLFLHHLRTEEVAGLLQGIGQTARLGFAGQDLVRSQMGYWYARAGTRVLSRSSVVHHDGPQSVRASWTVEEMRGLLTTAGLSADQCRVTAVWPERMLIRWMRHG